MSKRLKPFGFVFAVLLAAWSPWLLGAFVSWTAGSWETSPPGSESLSLTDDRIRELKENIRNRLQVEHYFGTGVAANDNGRHRSGSAVAWNASPCPTGNVTGDPGTGTTAYGASDNGRLCRDSSTGELKIWNGSAYITAMSATTGNASNRIDLLSGVQFFKAGIDPMDIHDHDIRHRISGTNGAWVVGADLLPFHIADVQITATKLTPNCNSFSNLALTAQAFGSGGDACFSITRDFTGRGGATTKGFLYGRITFAATGSACRGRMMIYRDAFANPISTAEAQMSIDNTGQFATLTLFSYVTGLTSAAHEFAMHVSDNGDDDCTSGVDPGELIWVDLGT